MCFYIPIFIQNFGKMCHKNQLNAIHAWIQGNSQKSREIECFIQGSLVLMGLVSLYLSNCAHSLYPELTGAIGGSPLQSPGK